MQLKQGLMRHGGPEHTGFYKSLEVTVRVNNAPTEQERGNHTFKHTITLLGQTLKKCRGQTSIISLCSLPLGLGLLLLVISKDILLQNKHVSK